MPVFAPAAGSTKGAVVPIAYSTVTNTTTANVIFNNVPQAYQDLMLVASVANASYTNGYGIYVNLNNDGSNIYSITNLSAAGLSGANLTTATSTRLLAQGGSQMGMTVSNGPAALFSSLIVHVLNYTNSSFNKTMISRCAADNNNGPSYNDMSVGLYRSTSPVTSIQFNIPGLYLRVGTTATLYGVRGVNQ